jgi:hypothetical protein
MPNIQVTSENLWCEYYVDDTEENGFFINNVYVGTDPTRTNIYDWLSVSAIKYIEQAVLRDMDIRNIWEG